MESSGGGGWSSAPPAAAAVPPASRRSLPRRPGAATAGAGGRRREVPGTELTQVNRGCARRGKPGTSRPPQRARGGGGLPALREPPASAAWSGAWCSEEKSCKGGPRARSALVCAPVPGGALVTGTAAAGAEAAALPEPAAGGSRLRRGRPLTPGLRRTKGEAKGEESGRELLCLLPPDAAEFHLSGVATCAPAFCQGPRPERGALVNFSR